MSLKRTLAALAVLGLAACSNADSSDVTPEKVIKGIVKPKKAPPPPTAQELGQFAAQALARTPNGVIVISIPKHNVASVMQEIERNGAYKTFGSSDRRSVSMRGGMITATRGLGNDMMSANVDEVQALISGKRDGSGQRYERYLDGEDIIEVVQTNCIINVEGASHVAVGELNRPVTAMRESCRWKETQFINTYLVDGAGRILQSKQWISPLNEYMIVQHLR